MRLRRSKNTLLVTITIYWSLLASKLCSILAAANTPVTNSDKTGGDRQRVSTTSDLSVSETLLQDILLQSLHEFSPELATRLELSGLLDNARGGERYFDSQQTTTDEDGNTIDVIRPEEELLRSSFIPTGLHDGERLADQLVALRSGNIGQQLLDMVTENLVDEAVIQELFMQFTDYINQQSANTIDVYNEGDASIDASQQQSSAAEDGEFHDATKGRGPPRNQTGGYEGCRRDYAQLAEPTTDRIIAAVHRAVIRVETLCATVRCRDTPFPKLCNAVCGFFLVFPPLPRPPEFPTKNYTEDTMDSKYYETL
jgi:hypothetical protein